MSNAARHESPRQHLSRLAAGLRISSSLDPEAVLDEIATSARTLAGARYAVLVTLDNLRQVEQVSTSGFTPEEHQACFGYAHGKTLTRRLGRFTAPFRVANLQALLRARKLPLFQPPFQPGAVLSVPIGQDAAQLGNIVVARASGEDEFGPADEEILTLFATQAAVALANACRHAELKALFDSLPVGVVVLDAGTGAPSWISRETSRMLEPLLAPERLAEELSKLVSIRRTDGEVFSLAESQLVPRLSAGESVRAEEITVSVPDGRSLTLTMSAAPLYAPAGFVEAVVVTLQDSHPTTEWARRQNEFMAMVAHELRTPLTSIQGSAEAVLAGIDTLAPEVRQFVRIIEEQAGRTQRLIGDLLGPHKIAADRLPIAAAPVPLQQLIEEARSAFLGAGADRQIALNVPANLPLVHADDDRIVQVIRHLLEQAGARSSPMSPIGLSVTEKDSYISISVEDPGAIADGGLPQPTDMVSSVDVDAAAWFERDGRELALQNSRGIIEAHGGRLWTENGAPSRGIRFTFTLPVAELDQAQSGQPLNPESTSVKGTRLVPRRILVVDDDPRTLRQVREILAPAGYEAVLTADPRELPSLIKERQPDLVLLDLVFPGVDGIELMTELFEPSRIPVIFLSAYGRHETIAEALRLGASDYVVKPFSTTELVARIEVVLRQAGQGARDEPMTTFSFGDLEIDYAARTVLVAGRPVSLGPTEYGLLRELSLRPGRVLTYEHLLQDVWGLRESTDPRPIRTAVRRLRRKLGDDAAAPRYIFAERAVGYRLGRPGEQGVGSS